MKNFHQYSIIFLFGFLSGLPQSLFSTTLQAWFVHSGYSVGMVSNLSLLYLFFLLRIFWGPLSDRFYIHRFGRRKTWIFSVQILLFICLECMALSAPQAHFYALIIGGAIIALLSSIQDAVIDAHRIEYIPSHQYGLAAVIAVYAYRLALLVAGGGALVFAHYYGFAKAYAALGLFFLVGALAIFWSPEPSVINQNQKNTSFWQAYADIFHQPWCYSMMGFIFCLHFGQIFVSHSSILIIPFLMKGLGLSLPKIAFLNKVVGLGVQLFGGALGAFLLLRYSLQPLLLIFGVLLSLSNLSFYYLSLHPQSDALLWFSVVFENISSGVCVTTLVAFMMRIVNPLFTASQFSFWMMICIVPRLLAAPLVGFMYPRYGWSGLFLLSTMISMGFIIFLKRLPQKLFQDEFVALV